MFLGSQMASVQIPALLSASFRASCESLNLLCLRFLISESRTATHRVCHRSGSLGNRFCDSCTQDFSGASEGTREAGFQQHGRGDKSQEGPLHRWSRPSPLGLTWGHSSFRLGQEGSLVEVKYGGRLRSEPLPPTLCATQSCVPPEPCHLL